MMGNEIEKGALYVVATPIGNMGDINARAVSTLKQADFVAAEDKRVAGKLLMLLGLKKPLVAYFEHNKNAMHEPIINRLLGGESCALVCDAGTPTISDPGGELVRLCHQAGVKVVPVPGASALVAALSVSGILAAGFVFEGFLPDKNSERSRKLAELAAENRAIVLYCAPHDIEKRLSELFEALGDRELFIARELTKLNEELVLTRLGAAAENPPKQRGEFVLVIGAREKTDAFWREMTVAEHINYYQKLGESAMDACKLCAADRKRAKSEIYAEYIKTKDDTFTEGMGK